MRLSEPKRPDAPAARSILIVSNGHGEDAVGALLARKLRGRAFEVIAYPLVGEGSAYEGIPMLEPRKALPSGGFAMRSGWWAPKHAFRDARAGGLRLWMDQRRTLRQQAGQHTLVVAVGDVYCCWMARHAGSPIIFVATAKSEHNERHSLLERWILRSYADHVFTRDEPTAQALVRRRVRARYVGNPLMDAIPQTGNRLPLPSPAPVVALLPGSRADGLRNVVELLKLCRRVSASETALFVCALPSNLRMGEVARVAERAGWEVSGESLISDEARVLLTREFGSVLRSAMIAVGLAGTANEQAAGMGMPVVTFPMKGAVQVTPRFVHLQQRLLGDALVTTPNWEDAADAVVDLLRDSAERERRGEAGRSRMGGSGAIDRLAETIKSAY